MVTELIDSILKVAWSDKKAKDLFDISLTFNEYPGHYDDLDLGAIEHGQLISSQQAASILDSAYNNDRCWNFIWLSILPKNDDGKNLAHLLDVFDVDASYNG